jgi:hypothetical protein
MKLRPTAWIWARGCAAAVVGGDAMAQSRDVVPEVRANVSGGLGARRFSAAERAASFMQADINRDGELTIRPYSFEEMDVNRDGVISRFEYEEATR